MTSVVEHLIFWWYLKTGMESSAALKLTKNSFVVL